ncbi:MAG: hypothetical protein Q7S04_04700 [Candidatus Moranbacteria bacterium]|nr:hypothetical protein [Candidatus Moranbacteria bacterium]
MKNFCQKLFFAKSGLYSCLAFFSFGLMSVLPTASQMIPDISLSEAKSVGMVTTEEANENAAELCRLQSDVALFTALQEQKNDILQTDTLCDKKTQTMVKAVGKGDVHFDKALGDTIREMTIGYPMEKMAPIIARYDREVAALIVGIAKKESDWGKHSPSDQSGADCFNYWGYKGAGSRGVAMGHGCFGSPEEAVVTVGDRLRKLVSLRQTSEPKNMVVWKCGSSCKGHSQESVKKWVADVSLYYQRIVAE